MVVVIARARVAAIATAWILASSASIVGAQPTARGDGGAQRGARDGGARRPTKTRPAPQRRARDAGTAAMDGAVASDAALDARATPSIDGETGTSIDARDAASRTAITTPSADAATAIAATTTTSDAALATTTPVDAALATATPIDATLATTPSADAAMATTSSVDATFAVAVPIDATVAVAAPIDATVAVTTPIDATIATATSTIADAGTTTSAAADASPIVVVVVAPPPVPAVVPRPGIPIRDRDPTRAPPSRPDRAEPRPAPAEAPAPAAPPTSYDVRELIPIFPETGLFGFVAFVLLLAILVAAATGLRWLRRVLPDRGLVPRALGGLHVVVRLLALLVGLVILAALLPVWMGPTFPWVLLGAALAVGWSARDVLPDVLAGVVLTIERRVRRGLWISGDGFSGTVEHVGWRATTLRDPDGHDATLPNRLLTRAAIVVDRFPRPRIRVRMRTSVASSDVRRALTDAVLLSPWVRLDVAPEILRDATDPDVWHVQARLLDIRHLRRFESELVERVDEILASAGTDVSAPAP